MRKSNTQSVMICGMEYPRWVHKEGKNGKESKVVNNPDEAQAFYQGTEYKAPPESPSDVSYAPVDVLMNKVEQHKKQLIEIFNHMDLTNRSLMISNLVSTLDSLYGGIKQEYETLNKIEGPVSGLPAKKIKKVKTGA